MWGGGAREGQHRGRSEPAAHGRGHLGLPRPFFRAGDRNPGRAGGGRAPGGEGWGRSIPTTPSGQGIRAPCRFPGWQPAPILLSPKSGNSSKAARIKSIPDTVFCKMRVAAEPPSPAAGPHCFPRHATKGRGTRERDRTPHPAPGFPRHFLPAWNGHPMAP